MEQFIIQANQFLKQHTTSSKIFGVLNVTPDSFSDGGRYNNFDAAIKRAEQMIEEGADVIDIGAESTRPYAPVLKIEEEWSRLSEILPAVSRLARSNNVKLSLDSRNYETLKKAIDYVDIINDVSGFADDRTIHLIRDSGVEAVMMHNMGIPVNLNIQLPKSENPVAYIKNWAYVKLKHLDSAGVDIQKIIFDPGIGFGLNATQSIYVLNHVFDFMGLGCKILIGHSRKSFLKYFDAYSVHDERDYYSALISLYLSYCKVDYLRVHNISLTKKLFRNVDSFFSTKYDQE